MVTGVQSVSFKPTATVGHKQTKMMTSGITLPSMDDELKAKDTQASSPAAQLAAQGAPVDTAKVDAIREGIANGSYKVDHKAIADAMIKQDLPVKA